MPTASVASTAAPVELVCACANLRRAARALSRVYEEHLAAVDLSSTQMTLLMALSRKGPLPLSDLAAFLEMDRTSLYRALRPLETRGLVATHATDGRTKAADLTAKGRRHFERALPHWEAAQRKFLEAYGSTAWKSLHEGLTMVVRVTGDI
jgi:DNA-binding MarR family transcriptional regulator